MEDKMEIKRDSYLKQLYLRENNGFIKVITGVRRCGKSYLLFKLFKKELMTRGIEDDHIISIALDNIENRGLREPVALYEYIKEQFKDNGLYYVLLDEIQFVPDFSEVLNSLLQLEHADIYVTGSNSKFLSSDILTEFRGRGDEVRVYPLSFAEYVTAFRGTEEDAFNEYMTFSGLPRILSFQTDEQSFRSRFSDQSHKAGKYLPHSAAKQYHRQNHQKIYGLSGGCLFDRHCNPL